MILRFFFKCLFIINSLLISFSAPCQTSDDSTYYESLYYLCKVWGHIKYYHSEVAKGNINWDNRLLETIPEIKSADSNVDFNNVMASMISSAGEMEIRNAELPPVPDSLNNNLDLDWIHDPIFSDSVSALIDTIIHRFRPQTNVYVDQAFSDGNPTYDKDDQYYQEAEYPLEDKRLLALFRYWNIIHYFFPYKDIMDQEWDLTLTEFIPRIVNAEDANSYHLTFKELATRINDSHAFLYSVIIRQWQGNMFPPFLARFIENEMVITKVIEGISVVQPGDVIKEIDGQDVHMLRENFRKYAHGSNEAFINSELNDILLWGNSQSMEIKVDNSSSVFTVTLTRSHGNYDALRESRRPEWRMITSNDGCSVGIVNMGVLEVDQVEEMFDALWDTDAIIFDIRNYPRGTLWEIVNFLYPEAIHIANFTAPDITYPGRLYWNQEHIGSGTSTPYPGKVIILFDERTLSQAEYTVMGLEQFPDAIKIGNTTAAADGNVSKILLPGGITTYATFLGTYYPDYTPTQRIGIIPDFEVHSTISGIRAGNDELLEFAFDYLNCDLITGIESEIGLINSKIRFYPNPVSNILYYEIVENTNSSAILFEISDIQGQGIEIIHKNTISGELNLSGLRRGVYIIKIITSKNTFSKTIIKK